MSSEVVRRDLLEHLPNLRAFAMSLRHNRQDADDLLQETILKAWSSLDTFKEGTNLRAWLFTIMRNAHISDYRKRQKESLNEDLTDALEIGAPPKQLGAVEAQDIADALQKLNDDQREILILIAAEGFNYEETAAIMECPIGTIKSRLNRARSRLAQLLAANSLRDVYSADDN